MRSLNHRFRKDRSTDVLAFALREAERLSRVSRQVLGDIVISVPTALRQAKEGRRSLEEEIVALLIHEPFTYAVMTTSVAMPNPVGCDGKSGRSGSPLAGLGVS